MIFLASTLMLGSCQDETKESEQLEAAKSAEEENLATAKIVSLSGSLTELAYSLGLGEQLVGVDVTSSYPAAVNQLPKLGHVRQLNLEGVLALDPTHLLLDKKDAALPAVQQLRKHPSLTIIEIEIEQSLEAPIKAAKALDAAIEEDLSPAIAKLEEQHETALAKLKALELADEKPKILFIYARGSKNLMVGGENTAVAKMIELAGAENAITAFEDYQTLTPEALLQAAPDVILMFESGLKSLAEKEQEAKQVLWNIPALAETPAGKAGRVIAMDGHYLSSFGPRVAEAVYDLAKTIDSSNTPNATAL